jgi:hypothetical protein
MNSDSQHSPLLIEFSPRRLPLTLPHSRLVFRALLCCCTALLTCFPALLAAAVPSQPNAGSGNPVQVLIERYSTDHDLLTNVYNDPLSPVTRERMGRFIVETRKQLAGVRFESLDQEGKADYLLLANHLTREEHLLALEEAQWKQVEPLLPVAAEIFALEGERRAIAPPDGERIALRLNAMTAKLASARKDLEARPANARPSRIDAWRAAEDLDELHDQLHRWFEFYNGYDPRFSWWAAQPYKQLDGALKDYAAFLREKMAGVAPDDKATVIGMPVGRQALVDQLAGEMIPYSPEELIAMAREQMAWCQQQMRAASREMGYGDDWHKALEKVKSEYVEPGRQPQLIHDLAVEGADFAEKNNLVTVPALAREGWRMEMMTPERQLVNPFFTGGDTISVSYPTDTMTIDQRLMSMRGNNIGFAHATVFHELIPGHWLQEYSTARYRPYRQLFSTGFWVEGNALYWEMTFWDRGFDRTPEERVGALFWRMHRCARIIFSLSFHLEQMTPEQAIDYLVNEVGHERDNAVAEVRRSFNGSYDPLYQSAYLVGGMQFRALRRELVESGRMTDREFNDAVLHENMMPVEMLRAILEQKPLTPDWKPSWRFLDAQAGK